MKTTDEYVEYLAGLPCCEMLVVSQQLMATSFMDEIRFAEEMFRPIYAEAEENICMTVWMCGKYR